MIKDLKVFQLDAWEDFRGDIYTTWDSEKYPDLNEKYDLLNNMGYGTAKHIDGIKKFGLSKFHRRTFGICQTFDMDSSSSDSD
mgnify:CR=1 FL=1